MPVGAGRGGGLMTNLSQFFDEKPLDSSCLQGGMVTTVLGLSEQTGQSDPGITIKFYRLGDSCCPSTN